MRTLIINTILLTLWHLDMFQPLNSWNRYISTARSTKWVTRYKILFSDLRV